MAKVRQRVLAMISASHPRDLCDYGCTFLVETIGESDRPQVVVIEPNDTSGDNRPKSWKEYRFDIDRCTYIDGVLSDNPYHPESAVWFADDLESIADSIGATKEDMIEHFQSPDPIDRAVAYQAIGKNTGHGFLEFDQYPLEFTKRSEVYRRWMPSLMAWHRRTYRKFYAEAK
jgi:hypothetical protein